MKAKTQKILIISGIVIFLLLSIGGAFYFDKPRTVEIEAKEEGREEETVILPRHPLSGKRCENHKARPFAVMLAEDTQTRPLSAVSMADLIVEMPVIKDGITRMMAFYACGEPAEIGSVRSARDDFIPIAAAYDAIYAHWGGSKYALDDLNRGVVDNIDALINPYRVYYRKPGIAAPHNGFTSYDKLYTAASLLNYRLETNFKPYPLEPENPPAENESVPVTVSIGYPSPFDVSYIYSTKENRYLRFRGNMPENDAIDQKQAGAKVLIVMKTNTRHLSGQYNDVDVTGEGEALIFQNGELIRARWQKSPDKLDSRLEFIDEEGEQIAFVAGTRWIHVVDVYTAIQWGEEIL